MAAGCGDVHLRGSHPWGRYTERGVAFPKGRKRCRRRCAPGAHPEEIPDSPDHLDTDLVRVSVVLEKPATLAAGFSPEHLAENLQAASYRRSLRQLQEDVAARMETATGKAPDIVWNLTLAANILSVNVEYRANFQN